MDINKNRYKDKIYYLSLIHIFYIGAFPVPINTRWEKHELFNVLDDSESTYIIMEKRVGGIEYGPVSYKDLVI